MLYPIHVIKYFRIYSWRHRIWKYTKKFSNIKNKTKLKHFTFIYVKEIEKNNMNTMFHNNLSFNETSNHIWSNNCLKVLNRLTTNWNKYNSDINLHCSIFYQIYLRIPLPMTSHLQAAIFRQCYKPRDHHCLPVTFISSITSSPLWINKKYNSNNNSSTT